MVNHLTSNIHGWTHTEATGLMDEPVVLSNSAEKDSLEASVEPVIVSCDQLSPAHTTVAEKFGTLMWIAISMSDHCARQKRTSATAVT